MVLEVAARYLLGQFTIFSLHTRARARSLWPILIIFRINFVCVSGLQCRIIIISFQSIDGFLMAISRLCVCIACHYEYQRYTFDTVPDASQI